MGCNSDASKERNEERKRKIREAFQGKSGVEIIPSNKELGESGQTTPLRVAPYCRVSTMMSDQAESFEIQRQYYVDMVNKRDGWELYRVYADEGISATSVSKRAEFLNMIEECKQGKIDLIVTKSVSRFARNAVDCLTYIRLLKNLNHPVGVFFETENINTLNQSGEMLLGILANFAQQESENKSLSVKWGIRNRFENGIPKIRKCLGYDVTEGRLPNGVVGKILEINEEEAKIVRKIYNFFLEGISISGIMRRMNNLEIPSPTGVKWTYSTVHYILTNEKYCGDVLMQKSVTVDIFSHRKIRNDGAERQYWIRDVHDPIIERTIWESVQVQINKEKGTIRKSKIKLCPYNSSSRLLMGMDMVVFGKE